MTVTIGLLRLTDTAPVIVAQEKGLFAARGLDVRLSVEPSWANIADKLAYGRLQAAVLMPPLTFSVALGLRGAPARVIVPMMINLGGNGITASTALIDALELTPGMGALEIGARLKAYRAGLGRPLRFAVVHNFSSHNLQFRYWLAACGIEPDVDVAFSVVPPAETVDALGAGRIDGFCSGAPWSAVAVRAGVGKILLTSSDIWSHHPEKCLAVSEDWADADPAGLAAMMTALLDAARYCDRPENAQEIARLLGQDRYLAAEPGAIRETLPFGDPGRHWAGEATFFAGAANFPWRSHALWFLDQMSRWRLLPPEIDKATAASIYRPDLFRAVAERAGISAPLVDTKPDGAHAAPWTIEGRPAPIEMAPDLLCDGAVF